MIEVDILLIDKSVMKLFKTEFMSGGWSDIVDEKFTAAVIWE